MGRCVVVGYGIEGERRLDSPSSYPPQVAFVRGVDVPEQVRWIRLIRCRLPIGVKSLDWAGSLSRDLDLVGVGF